MKDVFKNYPNLYAIDKRTYDNIWKPIQFDDILEFTIITTKGRFATQEYDNTTNDDRSIYYIQKYKTLFLYKDLCKFIEEHPDEKFIIMHDSDGDKTRIFTYIDSKDNELKTYYYNCYNGSGKFTLLAELDNKIGTAEWDKAKLYDITTSFNNETNRYGSSGVCYLRIGEDAQSSFKLLDGSGSQLDSNEIMIRNLKLPGQTRIVAKCESNNDFHYTIEVGPEATASITERYGITKPQRNYWYTQECYNEDDEFPDAPLDQDTFDRVKDHIIRCIESGDCHATAGGWRQYQVMTKGVLVISKPVAGHRRPTYHLIQGFTNAGVIDVVEIVRGELQMKDMLPVSTYYLCSKTGKFARASYQLYSTLKEMVKEAEIDRQTYEMWSEEKALHPELLTALSTHTKGQIDLNDVKALNRARFGALFMEHLIKNGMSELAIALANYIANRADNMNYVCGSLQDVFPGANADGTSVMKVLNMNKPCYDLLLSTYSKMQRFDVFQTAYKAIKTFAPDGIMNGERQKLVEKYMALYLENWTEYRCGTGRTVDVINYPDDIKSIYKMVDRINHGIWSSKWEVSRKYKEIVQAYFNFKDFGWDPAESQIYIEFGLNGATADVEKMLGDREHAANVALDIYKDKIEEKARTRIEAQYQFRKEHALKRLETPEKGLKTMKIGLQEYAVIAPSKIYGAHTARTVEKEGRDMAHCVYRSYAGQIAAGTYTVLYLRDKDNLDESLVTIGITNEGRINQTFAHGDAPISKEQAMAIVEWAKSKTGLVTFKSEHKTVAPGGWCHGIELPELPEPDTDWLKKLAKIAA